MKTYGQIKERRMYMEKFREMLSVIEEECVNKNQDYKTAAELYLNWNEKYLQNIFEFIADTSLREYIHRRRLTEAYKKIEDFDHQKLTYTVNGVKRAKSKIIKKFGNPPIGLQESFRNVHDGQNFFHRLSWKLEAGVKKGKVINTNKIVLFSKNEGLKYNFDKTYFIYGNKYFCFQGSDAGNKIRGNKIRKDMWLSYLFHTNVVYCELVRASSNRIIEKIYYGLKGEKIDLDGPIQCNIDLTSGGMDFDICNLVYRKKECNDGTVKLKCSPMLRIENDDLILDLDKLVG